VSQAPAPHKDRAEERIGTTIAGRYRIARVLGSGGMGSVYEAEHMTTGKRVAVKILAGSLSRDLKLVARFRREAVAASRLDHENCVHVDDFGEEKDGTFYIVMELVNGRGLADELRASGPMSPERVARIGVQLLKALDAAHTAGVLHRDLKPQNVMLTQKAGRPDIVKVVDFGIAKITTNDSRDQQALTIPGTIFGTPEYMSPEQARGETLDARSDLYSAAVVLWHMLLGRSPFRGTTVRDTLMKVFSDAAPSPTQERPGITMPPGFENALRKGLAKNKDQRYSDAAAFAAALAPFVDGVVVDVPARARPGLPLDGQAPAPTLDKFPAVEIAVPPKDAPRLGVRDTEPDIRRPIVTTTQQPSPQTSSAPATDVQTRFGSPSMLPPSFTPPRPAPPVPASVPLAVPPSAPLSASQITAAPVSGPALPPSAATVPLMEAARPVVPEGAPKEARVLTVDTVKRASGAEAPPPPMSAPVIERRSSPVSVAAIVVIVGGLLLLGGFVFFAVLVVQGKLDVGGSAGAGAGTTIGAPTTTTSPSTTTPPATPAPSTSLQDLLVGNEPLNPLARDAALGRAERAIAEGNSKEARKAFEDALAADPTAPAALSGLGTLAMQQRDYTTARDCFGKLIDVDKAYRKQFGPLFARAKKLADAPQ
jgi:serine/threonine protein kinase